MRKAVSTRPSVLQRMVTADRFASAFGAAGRPRCREHCTLTSEQAANPSDLTVVVAGTGLLIALAVAVCHSYE